MTTARPVLRVLHLASFVGNIGDLANHAGARRMMRTHLDFDMEFTELEIREFYWKMRSFDDDFVTYANGFDLLIVGGGNYFELWVDHSATGTSIDITPERLARLTVPTLFYALGVDTGQGVSARSAERFHAFVSTVLERDDMFVCVRNDGSRLALRTVLGDAFAERIPVMPDGGFFAHDPARVRARPAPTLGINIAGDMLDRRFDGELTPDAFLKELAGGCAAFLDAHPDWTIALMPHIWRDLQVVAALLPAIPDPLLRRRVVVGPLQPVAAGLDDFLGHYGGFELVAGMRFHANVCAVGAGVPSRGLHNYPQVARLYEELGMDDRLIDVRSAGFGARMVDDFGADIAAATTLRADLGRRLGALEAQAVGVLETIDRWLKTNRGP